MSFAIPCLLRPNGRATSTEYDALAAHLAGRVGDRIVHADGDVGKVDVGMGLPAGLAPLTASGVGMGLPAGLAPLTASGAADVEVDSAVDTDVLEEAGPVVFAALLPPLVASFPALAQIAKPVGTEGLRRGRR